MVIINGSKFKSEDGFYNTIEKLFEIETQWGRNLDAFEDLLEGGFGNIDYNDKIEIKWINYKKSVEFLKPTLLNAIVEILIESENIIFEKYDYNYKS